MALTALMALGPLAGCGDDEGSTTELDAETWAARADRFCTDGVQEATALPLPQKAKDVPADADARAAIVATVGDGIITLGSPEGVDAEALGIYIAELAADNAELTQAADSPAGGPILIDESAGQAANELGLEGCAAFSNAIARTP